MPSVEMGGSLWTKKEENNESVSRLKMGINAGNLLNTFPDRIPKPRKSPHFRTEYLNTTTE